jgi:hypothetical protein
MRFIDEETLKSIDTEFLLKQETKRSDCIKDPIFNNQFVRTSEQIKVLQLKKHVFQIVKQSNPQASLSIHDITMLLYCPSGEIKLKNDQSLKDIIELKYWNEYKARISNKKELALKDDSRVMEIIWICFHKAI